MSTTMTQAPAIAIALQEALQHQRKAYFQRPVPTYAERLADLAQLERMVRRHQDEFIEAISQDYGHRSRHETLLTEIGPFLSSVRHCRKHLKSWMRPQRRAVDRLAFGLGRNRVIPQPLGVVGVIVPWNFPLNLSLIPLCFIFAAGNRAMVKMSENSRHLCQRLKAIAPQYFGPDKLHFFEETGSVGIEFSKLPFDHLLFTGSGTTGRAVMAAAAQNLCPVTLELGGKAPAIVCDDFDIRLAAQRISFIKYLNAGQICTTVDHVFVPRAQVAAFVAHVKALVPQRYAHIDSPDLTSIIDARAFERLTQSLAQAQDLGAEVLPLLPGPALDAERHRIVPHLVLHAPRDCALMQREIFGPILPVVPYDDLDEVVQQINAGPRPLAIYPFSNRNERINHLIEQVMSGGVTVNDALLHVGQEDLPFGGVGESGMGHYHGHEGFLTFSKLRPVFYQSRWSSLQWLMPPYGKTAERLLRFLTR